MFGAGCLKALCGACVKPDPWVGTRVTPPDSADTVMMDGQCPLRRWPTGAGVGQARRDQAAQVERGGPVMQPVVVLDDAAVADFAVAAGQPGDRAFHHRTVLTVFGLPVGIASIGARRRNSGS